MAVEAYGRIGAESDSVNHLLSRTVMAGGAGTCPVGRNIVLDSIDFRPGRHNMTFTAELSRRIIGKIASTHLDSMRMR